MDQQTRAEDFLSFVQASPTPRHCVAESMRRLMAAGFENQSAEPELHPLGFQARGGSLLAWRHGTSNAPLRVITAHTDSPNLRLKPVPDQTSAGMAQLGVEVYGGALVNSWLDRELSLAGHIAVRTGNGIETRLIRIDEPLLRIPQLAIHLDRDISTKGLHLNKQNHLRPVWAMQTNSEEASSSDSHTLATMLSTHCDVDADQLLAFELMMYDTTPPAFWGHDRRFIASPRIDNQLSCWAAIDALAAAETDATCVVALFDHEEVGSTSATGADSNLLGDLLDRFTGGPLSSPPPRSLCVSADCAHATHPNYVDRHDAEHTITLNGGPVVKVNANERYATTPTGHAMFVAACDDADIEHQVFVSRTDMACGSTVGPVTAARTGLDTVDVGAPQLAMHSIRETTGASDPVMLADALTAVLELH